MHERFESEISLHYGIYIEHVRDKHDPQPYICTIGSKSSATLPKSIQ